MACSSGGCGKTDGGGCSSGGCNRVNSYDWFADIPLSDQYNFNTVEISFKNGSRKAFFTNDNKLELYKGDAVIVEAAQGYDIGEVSLKGELVKLQMKRKNVKESADTIRKILRKASENDIEKLEELRASERDIMIKARVISRELKLDMKLGDVEYQGDGKKVTFYYTAENRIDFRELVKRYVSEFKVKIEMRQIGARQEAGRIGGIGSCGRELCCSTWITDFQSVSTGAARYQQLSINTEKLSGQCGRLKCCLNYELDTYLDALKTIPKNSDKLKTQEGIAFLRKTDVFKGELTYSIEKINKFYKLSAEDVKKVLLMNKNDEKPASLVDFNIETITEKSKDVYEDLVGQVSLKAIEKKPSNNNNRNKNKRRKNNNNKKGGNNQAPKPQ
jgi:cell fate regulator YaaT (PSP1 superfamily)